MDNVSLRTLVLDVFELAAHPLTATDAARAAGIDPISGAAAVYKLAHSGALVRVNQRQPLRYELAHRAALRGLRLPMLGTVPGGALTPFGLVCGGGA